MNKYSSIAAPLIQDFIVYRKASDQWTASYESNILSFDRFCLQQYPKAQKLSQQMVNEWCKKRDTESSNSCISRTSVVVSFLRYFKNRGKTDIVLPEIPKKNPRTYIPHAFTNVELKNFFEACDNMTGNKSLIQRSNRIEIPIIFRLLFSSGIRTIEARLLRVQDVNLNDGILNIRYSKGKEQHFVVLHDSMLQLMIAYDLAISRVYPNRTIFFPDANGKCHKRRWLSDNFKKLWNEKNITCPTPYDLRHHYAIVNINRWVCEGMGFHAKFMYLSKSMGHSVLESTKYYYSITPGFADILKDKTNESFNNIIPEVE